MNSFRPIFAALLVACVARGVESARTASPTIKNVVHMLEQMIEKSKEDGDKDRVLYAKYLCYCNNQKETKTKEIEDLAKDIAQQENTIDETLSDNGEQSVGVAELKDAIEEKDRQIAEANALQGARQKAWDALSKDLTDSIASMRDAIKVLAAVGADQTKSVGADHTQYMAGYQGASLLKIQSQVKVALSAAQAFMPADKVEHVQSFLQAPFTGTYTSQSGEVMGILKNMRDTFKANYKTSESAFNAESKASAALVKELEAAKKTMEALQKKKEGELGVNDGTLGSTRGSLQSDKDSKKAKEDFLAELMPICKRKTEEYNHRNEMRANEDVAISEAIAILNKDSSFDSFKKVDATSFVQVSAAKSKNLRSGTVGPHAKQAQLLLMSVATEGSIGFARIAALIEANNPFEVVLAEIKKMIALIDAEGKTDKETLDWCVDERAKAAKTILAKTKQITALNLKINSLTKDIEAPVTGLKAMIEKTEADLEQNDLDQKTETADRKEENQNYQEKIANLVEAEDLLSSAIAVLTKYYSQISFAQGAAAPVEVVKQGPWTGDFGGQSTEGNKAITMLQFILKETQKEETQTHTTENSDQHDFEDSMQVLKKDQKKFEKNLASLRLTLADKEKELGEAQEELKKTEAELAAVEKYLVDIKPGCDFITTNFQLRTDHRAAETKALKGARDQLKAAPAYTAYTAEQHLEDLGECKDICVAEGEQQVKCKACLAKVTVPGYCAGHPTTDGC